MSSGYQILMAVRWPQGKNEDSTVAVKIVDCEIARTQARRCHGKVCTKTRLGCFEAGGFDE